MEQTVKVAEVVCGFTIAMGGHEVVVGIMAPLTGLPIAGAGGFLVETGGLLRVAAVLEGDGVENSDLRLGVF